MQAQYRGGGFARSERRAEQERYRLAAFGGDLQPPQLGEGDFHRPAEHAAAGARLQRLFDRPERVLRRAGTHDHHPRQIYAGGLQCWSVWQIRRRDPRNPAAGRGEARERGTKRADLAYAFVLGQQLGKRTGRPAASGQLRIQGGEAGRDHRQFSTRQFAGTPDQAVAMPETYQPLKMRSTPAISAATSLSGDMTPSRAGGLIMISSQTPATFAGIAVISTDDG